MSRALEFEQMLTGGKAFSLGRTVEVVDQVLADPKTFSEYLKLFALGDSQVVMRAANGLKRIFEAQPDLFEVHKGVVIPLLENCPHDSARWTLPQLIKKYKKCLNEEETSQALVTVRRFILESDEWITLVQSMDVLIGFKKLLEPDAELAKRVDGLSADSRKAVANKAAKLAALLPR